MINPSDRQARFEKFRLVDPQNTYQAIGYKHLIDETNLTLRPVPPWRAYVDLPRPDLPATPPAISPPDRSEFDETYYLCQYPGVERAVRKGRYASGWEHFIQQGLREGRLWRPPARLSGLDFAAIFRQRRMGSH